MKLPTPQIAKRVDLVIACQREYKRRMKEARAIPFGNRAQKTKLDAVLEARGLQ